MTSNDPARAKYSRPPKDPYIVDKIAHVKRAVQTRDHHCHWPGCTAQVPPAKWGCLAHWRALPKHLRDRIWSTYRPGQESDLKPSAAYLSVARDVQAWIVENRKGS